MSKDWRGDIVAKDYNNYKKMGYDLRTYKKKCEVTAKTVITDDEKRVVIDGILDDLDALGYNGECTEEGMAKAGGELVIASERLAAAKMRVAGAEPLAEGFKKRSAEIRGQMALERIEEAWQMYGDIIRNVLGAQNDYSRLMTASKSVVVSWPVANFIGRLGWIGRMAVRLFGNIQREYLILCSFGETHPARATWLVVDSKNRFWLVQAPTDEYKVLGLNHEGAVLWSRHGFSPSITAAPKKFFRAKERPELLADMPIHKLLFKTARLIREAAVETEAKANEITSEVVGFLGDDAITLA